jgi:hypothetical protein
MATSALDGVDLAHGRQGLPQALASEWIKFRSVRSTLVSLLVTFVLCVGIGAIACVARRGEPILDPTRVSLQGFALAEISIGVIGALVITSEYSSGSIRATLAAMPRRSTVLAAKAIVLFLVTFVVGELCAVVSFLVGQAILASGHQPSALSPFGTPTASLSASSSQRAVFLAGLSLALLAVVALGLGAMLRHTAGTITVYVSILLVLFLIVAALPTSWNTHVFKFLPEVMTEAMRSTEPLEGGVSALSAWPSTLLLAGYAVAALVGGAIVLHRRDA